MDDKESETYPGAGESAEIAQGQHGHHVRRCRGRAAIA